MKKLFLFLTMLALSIGQTWGADPTHADPAIVKVANRTFLDLQHTPSNVAVSTDNYSNYGPGYFISNKSADLSASWWSFSGTFKSTSSAYSNVSGAIGFHAVGSSSSDEFYQILQMRTGSDRMTQMDFYVTGTTQMGFQWKNAGTSGKYLTFTIYEMDVTGSTATDVTTPIATVQGSTTSNSDQYAATGVLDATKYYHVVVTPLNTSNINFYGLTFKHAPAASYTVTYKANGGNGEDITDDAATKVADCSFTNTGMDFTGWNTAADGKGTAYAVGATVSSDLTLYAQWVDHVAKYTVVYKDGTTELGSEQVAVGETPEGITAPTKDCYTFAAWSPALNTVSGEEDAEVVVNATWTPIYSSSATLISAENVTAKTNVNTIFAAANIVSSITFVAGNYEFTSNETKKGYYGYKDKQSGDNFKILLKQGKQVQVLFGNLGADPTIKINGANGALDAARASGDNVENTFTYHASEEDALISITLGSGTNTLKQITIADYVLSDDATIKSLTVNGEAVEAVEDVYSYVVGSTSEATKVAVVFVLNDTKATADKKSGFEIDVPEAGAAANTATITVTAEDGTTQKEYTVSVTKATAASTDATLKALSVEGFTLAPAFDPAVVEYTITKAYEAALPATSKVTATANDANATVNVAYNALVENEILVQVIAEDEETAKTYSIRVLSAPAVKSLSRVLFSNGFDAFIDNTNRTVKAFYLDGTEAPTATTITAGANCTAGEIVEGKITVTGADESVVDYTVTLEAVTPNTTTVAESANAGAFDGTETWVKNGLLVYGNTGGWVDADKYYVLRRQLKSGDAANDQRVIAGWVRTYFFVGNASKLELTIANNNKVKYAIDGGEPVASESNSLSITLEAGNHMIEIVTNQSSGDCRISAPKLVERPSIPSAITNTSAATKAQKRIENGQLVIEKNGKVFNAMGQTIR